MVSFLRTDSSNPNFIQLVQKLDADLALRDGADHDYYHQFNKIDQLKFVILAYLNSIPVACGAIKEFNKEAMEVKRMYVLPEYRGEGFGKNILTELEQWSTEMKYKKCLLETGKRQPEAMSLYHKMGYEIVPNYGQYKGIDNSVCFEKEL